MIHLNNNQKRQNCLLWVLALTDLIFPFNRSARNQALLAEVWISVHHFQNCWPLWEMLTSFDVTYCWANSISGTKNILGLYLSPLIFIQWHYHCSPSTDISQLRLLEKVAGWRERILKWPKDFVAFPLPFAYRGHKITHGKRLFKTRKQ